MKFYWIGWNAEHKTLVSGDADSTSNAIAILKANGVDLNNEDSYSIGTSVVSTFKQVNKDEEV